MRQACGCERIFRSERFRERASHLAEMRRRQFGRTPVNDRVDEAQKGCQLEVKAMCYGDPSVYPGMGPYEGFRRHLRRMLNFERDEGVASYRIWGDPQLVAQLRRGSAYLDDVSIPVPDHVAVYPSAGVAGALRMICPAILLPPGPDGIRDNVIVPKWTYLSHSAEAALSLADVRSCRLTREGQMDLGHMLEIMDRNTQAVILSTVGNPLGTAMSPQLFDDLVRAIHARMQTYGHPVVIVADVIYEHFRRRREERIDAIQRVLRLGLEVPVIETSSFSKMFGMAGYRLGYYRALWAEDGMFPDERHDFLLALNALYGTTLCPVPTILQRSTASLYAAINSKQPVEEELAPVAAVLTAMKDLTDKRGGGDTHTMMPPEIPESVVAQLGFNPGVWFTSSALSKRTRKLAGFELGKYNFDVKTEHVERIADMLVSAGLLEKRAIEVSRREIVNCLTNATFQFGDFDERLYLAIQRGTAYTGLRQDPTAVLSIVHEVLSELYRKHVPSRAAPPEAKWEQMEFGFSDTPADAGDSVKLAFYRLAEAAAVPDVKRNGPGTLRLEGISGDHQWVQVAKRCRLPTEDLLYEEHKKARRRRFERRTDYFIREIDKMAREGLGVYLHPVVYDEGGRLVPERINSFYVLFGFERLRDKPCQAAELVTLCKELDLPLLMFTPGDVFLPLSDREPGDSYIRAVTLDSQSRMDDVLGIIRKVATYLAQGENITYRPGPPTDGCPPAE